MLKRLRLQFIIVNAVVIIAVFIFFATGAWFFLQERLLNRLDHMSSNIMRDVDNGIIKEMPVMPPPPPEGHVAPLFMPKENHEESHPLLPAFFVAPISDDGMVGDYTHANRFSNDEVDALVRQALAQEETHGLLQIASSHYYFARIPRQNGAGEMVFAQDMQRDYAMLWEIEQVLLWSGLFCLALSVVGSVFLGNRAIKPIEKAWQQQKDFLADASHELRTPLSVISTNLEIVRDNPEELVGSQQNWLNNMAEETAHMTRLVDDLLFLARTDANQNVFDCSRFCLQHAVCHAVDSFTPVADNKGVHLSMLLDKMPLDFYGDEKRLRQVLKILLDNAIRHTSPGGMVTVRLDRKDGRIALCVADNGEGISPESLPHIFERFYQGDAAHAAGKAGLGLAIAKSIVERHGGEIWAVSRSKAGTDFFITLPLQS